MTIPDALGLSDPAILHRIKQVREVLKLTQKDFSAMLSLSNGYIGAVEVGITKLNGRLIKLIVSEFRVNETWLLTGEGEMFAPNADEKFAKLMGMFKELSPQYQDVVVKLVEGLRKAGEAG
jgi:transcriptional regulator with XRE-family HTH domain